MRQQWLVNSAVLLLLGILVGQCNHYLASVHVYLFAGGLFITYGALNLPLRDGTVSALLAGLFFDALTPVAFGTHGLLFIAAHAVLFNIRDRLPRTEIIGQAIIALLANLALFLVFSFLRIGDLPAPAAAWGRLLFDLVCSQIFIALVAPWFFALQSRTLVLAGWPVRS